MMGYLELLQKAYSLYNKNLYQDAGIYFLEALKYNPQDPHALCMLAVISHKIENWHNFNNLLCIMNKYIPDFGLTKYLNTLTTKELKKPNTPAYEGFLDYEFVRSLYSTYSADLYKLPLYSDPGLHINSVTQHIEADFLYFMIRLFRPKHVIEFSPYEGLSTAFIYEGLKANGQDFTLATFDLEEFEGFTKRMKQYDIDLKVITGDAIETIPSYLKTKGLVGNIDFCFIDSEHTYEFASRYCSEIIPLLGKDCVLMFHDVCYCPSEITKPFDHYGPVYPQEIVGHVVSNGEGQYLSEYFSKHKGYKLFLLHKLFGGFGLLSPKLPINNRLIHGIEKDTPQFFYKRDKKPSLEDRKIPTMMIAIPETVSIRYDFMKTGV